MYLQFLSLVSERFYYIRLSSLRLGIFLAIFLKTWSVGIFFFNLISILASLLLIYRTATSFCKLIPYPAHFPNVLISSQSFLVLRSFSTGSWTPYGFDFFLVQLYPSFFFLSRADTLNTMLNKSRDHRHLHHCKFYGNTGFSITTKLAIDFSHIVCIMVSCVPSGPGIFKAFIIKWCWILLKVFSSSIELIIWFLSTWLFMCTVTTFDLYMSSQTGLCGMKLTWS